VRDLKSLSMSRGAERARREDCTDPVRIKSSLVQAKAISFVI